MGEGMSQVAGFLRPEMFYTAPNAMIYGAIAFLHEKGGTINAVNVLERLKSTGELEGAGGAFRLSQLSASNMRFLDVEHARYIHQAWIARELFFAGNEFAKNAADESLDISDVLEEAIKRLEGIAGNMAHGSGAVTLGEACREALKLYDERKKLAKSGVRTGIDTGIYDLTSLTNGGWKNGQLIILAARTAMGKTALSLHFAKSAAQAGTPALIFSLEMNRESLARRFMLSETDIHMGRFQGGSLTGEEEGKVSGAVNSLYGLPVTIIDTSGKLSSG
jgi:replicative DNA helicase